MSIGSRDDEGGSAPGRRRHRVTCPQPSLTRRCADASAVTSLADAPVATPPLHPWRGGLHHVVAARGRVPRCGSDFRRDNRCPAERHLHPADVGAGGDPHRNGLRSSAGGDPTRSGAPPGAGLGRTYQPCRPDFLIESSSNRVTISVDASADSLDGLSVERWSATHFKEVPCAGGRASS